MFIWTFGKTKEEKTIDEGDLSILQECNLTLFQYGQLAGLPSYDPACLRIWVPLQCQVIHLMYIV